MGAISARSICNRLLYKLLPLPNGVLSADSGAEVEFVETALTGLEFAFSAGLLILPSAGLKLEGR